MPSIFSLVPAVLALVAGVAAIPKACSITTPSCQNTTAIADTCCFNAPGGAILLTQVISTTSNLVFDSD